MIGWHHQCNGCELGQTLGEDEGQRGLECCSPWDHQELDMTGRLNNSNNSSQSGDANSAVEYMGQAFRTRPGLEIGLCTLLA